jgi:hypothetical protein
MFHVSQIITGLYFNFFGHKWNGPFVGGDKVNRKGSSEVRQAKRDQEQTCTTNEYLGPFVGGDKVNRKGSSEVRQPKRDQEQTCTTNEYLGP